LFYETFYINKYLKYINISTTVSFLILLKTNILAWQQQFNWESFNSVFFLMAGKQLVLVTNLYRRFNWKIKRISHGQTQYFFIWLLHASQPVVFYVRPCQIGIVLSVNSSLTNLGTYSQKTHKPKTKTQLFYDKNNALYKHLYI